MAKGLRVSQLSTPAGLEGVTIGPSSPTAAAMAVLRNLATKFSSSLPALKIRTKLEATHLWL
jgi:hypothetical protein